MPSYLAPLFSAFRAAITDLAMWPEVEVNGVYHALEFARTPFTEKSDDQLPLAVMDFDLRPYAGAPITATGEEGTVTIYYVAQLEVDAMVAKLELLRNGLWATSPAGCQVLSFPAISFSLGLPINSFLIRSARTARAGAVIAPIVVGETP